ncbi:hypothetical protein HYQ46_012473 [Verticillium longisporum]|nr:hypothetical protein HYQ46_012473 [Verticillium longisporum]
MKAIRTYLATISGNRPPDIDGPIQFNHEDLGPPNIMIPEDGTVVTGIIDWESAAYHPRFWLATKPIYAGAFFLECETDEPRLWGQLLGQALDASGYKGEDAIFRHWITSIT